MTDQTNAAIPMVGGRQDRLAGPDRLASPDRDFSGAKSRENYEPATLAAPDVNGDDRTIVIKPRRFVAVTLDGAGGPVNIELSVEQAQAVGRALLDASAKLDAQRVF